MRKRFEQQLSLGIVPIAEVSFPLDSRHELTPVLMGLQRIFCDPELHASAFKLMEACMYGDDAGSQCIGRPGMTLWETMVLGVVRLCTDSDWDAQLQMANYDALLRGVLGVDGSFGSAKKEYHRQTLVDNVSLLDEATVNGINALVVGEGHRILKKKRDEGLEVKGDSYVVESDIHYPTDTGLLWDSARKCLDIMGYLSAEHGFCGWRKQRDWGKRLKSAERAVSQAFRCRGAGKEPRVARAALHYTALANALKVKVAAALPDVELFLRVTRVAEKYKLLPYYHGMLAKHLDIVGRRLLEGEKIPQSEKLFSIFQPMVEWISKGKAGKRVVPIAIGIGHKVLIATDQHGLILHHQVVQKTDDRDLAVPLAEALAAKYKLGSLSLDKGFYSKANKDAIVKLVPRLVMPKKGSLTAADREEEGGKQFKELKNRHSAVESNINQLEHNGLGKCRDKGFKAFTRYTALGVLSYNLHRVGSALLAAARKRRAEEQLQPLQEAA